MRLLRDALRVLAIGGLAALSLPGVHAARAGTDLLPPAKQFFSWRAAPPAAPAPPSGSPSCGGDPVEAMRQAQLGREAALAQIAQAMGAVPGGDGEPLNNRGYGYAMRRDPNLELFRVQQEAQRLKAAQQPSR
jgi:hypothetical protein